MTPASEITFRRLAPEDAEALNKILASEANEYCKYFHPFDFDVSSLRDALRKATRDQFIGIEILSEGNKELAGFYMLRGFDEGFADPMYGVFIASKFSGRGLGRLSLCQAESLCNLRGVDRLLLKVHPENRRAKRLYEQQGFSFVRIDPGNNNLILGKQLKASA